MPLSRAAEDGAAGELHRYMLRDREVNRVLGGGIVSGSVVLLGGEPGVGKSTLLLQIACEFSQGHGNVLYVTGEESARQVALRAARLGRDATRVNVLCETRLDVIEDVVLAERPKLVIVDSIQTTVHPDLESSAGSVAQVRECANALTQLAKREEITFFLVGHVNKQGALAGPKVLEHAVDVVLEFEGERQGPFRLLRSLKNRYGSTHEIGLFEMGAAGLAPVDNPSEYFLAERLRDSSGSVVVAAREGTRTILVEVQALVSPSAFGGTPRRQVSGLDYSRVSIVLAVLEKRVGLRLGTCDVYVNVAGGARLVEPACDLGVALAVASSFYDAPFPEGMIAFGEVGLAGEVRSVAFPDERLNEASRIGFTRALVPLDRKKGGQNGGAVGVACSPVRSVKEALQLAFGGKRGAGLEVLG